MRNFTCDSCDNRSATLSWALLYLCHHPIAQEKLAAEIHSVIGNSRAPSIMDKTK